MPIEAPGEPVQRLIAAARDGRGDEVSLLVESNPALADARDSNGVSAVMLALYHGQGDVARWLADRRSELDIFEAASLGDLGRVSAIVERDRDAVRAWSPDGFTALALAGFFGRLPVVRFLIERGADVNAVGRNEGKFTALTGAVTSGHADIVRELLRHGADVNYRYGAGFTPLHVAAANGRADIVRLLLQAGAEREARTTDGETARDFAVHRQQDEVVGILDGKSPKVAP